MSQTVLKAPFPAFGGKSKAAPLIWERMGDVDNYIEGFAFSAAVLLARPTAPKIETINDANPFAANFWRAVASDAGAMAAAVAADWPVNETDLHARHRWLVQSGSAAEFRERMKADPDYFDPKVAGWWAWGACCWIGSGWCDTVESSEWAQMPDITSARDTGKGVHGTTAPSEQLPKLAGGGKKTATTSYGGPHIHADKIDAAHRPQLADAFARGRGVHGFDEAETCDARREWLLGWFGRLRDRLRSVRVCCGDWERVCGSTSVTTRLGVTGLFLDPPYAHDTGRLAAWIVHLAGEGPEPPPAKGATSRAAHLYANDRAQDVDRLVARVHLYCRERGADPLMRIALAGYEGEHEALESLGWTAVAWKADGGYGNRSAKGRANRERERLWFSPACLDPDAGHYPLFGMAAP